MNSPGQSIIDALNTTIPTPRSSTMHIDRRQMNPLAIKHRCLVYCHPAYIYNREMNPLVNQ